MAYGSTDIIQEERKDRAEAVELLLDVATGEKTVEDVRQWLKENYPDEVVETTTTNKW